MFKKVVSFMLVGLVAVNVFSINASAKTKRTYTKKRIDYGVVVKIDTRTDETTVLTTDGNLWSFICDDSDIKDIYKITFDTKNTKDKKDDSIVNVHYIDTVVD